MARWVAGLAEQERVIAVHELVGDAHQFAKHFLRRIADADVVAVGLRHLANAVEAFEQRHHHHHLLCLAGFLLEVAADEDVEKLVGAAELDIGADFHRVPALHHRVLQFV